jgi:hypothetical protein
MRLVSLRSVIVIMIQQGLLEVVKLSYILAFTMRKQAWQKQ